MGASNADGRRRVPERLCGTPREQASDATVVEKPPTASRPDGRGPGHGVPGTAAQASVGGGLHVPPIETVSSGAPLHFFAAGISPASRIADNGLESYPRRRRAATPNTTTNSRPMQAGDECRRAHATPAIDGNAPPVPRSAGTPLPSVDPLQVALNKEFRRNASLARPTSGAELPTG